MPTVTDPITVGTITVANGSTSFTVAGGASLALVSEGDFLEAAGGIGIVAAVSSPAFLIGTLKTPWLGVSLTAQPFAIFPGWWRLDPDNVYAGVSELLDRLRAGEFFWNVPADLDEPDPDWGEDGDFAIKIVDGSFSTWLREDDEWVFQSSVRGLYWRGTWSGATAYVTQDAVELGGSSYVALANSTNVNPVGNPATWMLIASGASVADNAVTPAKLLAGTAAERAALRQRIYAAPFDALAHNNMALNSDFIVSQEKGDTAFTGITANAFYIQDQWKVTALGAVVVSAQRSQTSPPPGISNFLRTTITTEDASIAAGDVLTIEHSIEGYRTARLGFGAAGAQSVTIGFWARASITGTFGMALRNSVANRGHMTTFAINVADTWEFKTFTIAGDTSGTWLATTGVGLRVNITLSGGTNFQGTAGAWGATTPLTTSSQTNLSAATSRTFDITGFVVLPGVEVPSSDRLPLLMRPFAEELRGCQRFLQWVNRGKGRATSATSCYVVSNCIVPMRAAPSYSLILGTNALGEVGVSGRDISAVASTFNNSTVGAGLTLTSSGMTAGNLVMLSPDVNSILATSRL